MNYDEWFKSLNENGRTTYFLGQEGKVSKEAWDYQQKKIDELLKALEYVQQSCHKSISYEHDLFDKGWNQSSRQVIITIYRLTGVGENLINE